MADGETHFASNVLLGGAMTLAAAMYAPADALAPVVAGAVIGLFVTPDADLEGRSHAETLLRRVPVVGLLFQWAWYPYATLTRHRGVSHWPVLGTLGRAAYSALALALGGVFVVGWAALLGATWPELTLPQVTWAQGAWLFAAWAAQDLLHLLLDAFIKG